MSWVIGPKPSRRDRREASASSTGAEAPAGDARIIHRHPLLIRVTHWLNVVCMTVLLMSGLQIFNAHPALYWGEKSLFGHPWVAIGASEGGGGTTGVTEVLGHRFDTTGVLGLSRDSDGELQDRGFPAWATLPGPQWLAMGRRWHFFFAWLFVANGAVYVAYTLASRRLGRALWPTRPEIAHIGRSIFDHLRLRFPKGEAARHYNVLQKITYLLVVFGLAPAIILAGLTMSPHLDAGFPFLLTLFGGRQSARSIHFICAFAFLAFVAVHLLMVLLSGPLNNLRSMITGRYDVGED
jgi:thiosulfate reductase cytochrome b subunit